MSQSLFENYEMCYYGDCFLPWPGFQASEHVVHESDGNRFTLFHPVPQAFPSTIIQDPALIKPLTISRRFFPDNRCHGGTQAGQRERLRQARTFLGFQEMTHRFIDHVTGDEDHSAA